MIIAAPIVERMALDEGSWIDVVRGFMPVADADALCAELLVSASWVQGQVFRYEKYVPEPRLGAMQRGAGRHPALVEAQDWIQRRYRVMFDGLALARYRNERDSVGWHRDRQLKWLDDTVIGVLTLGQQRPFVVKPNSGRGQRDNSDDSYAGATDLSPASGDLLVMGGRCQRDWLHAVPKSTQAMRDRVSVQWRWTSKRGRPDTAPSFYDRREFGRR
ncbi:MAG: alpha-ketoglutarate-dependent dioxygenase AlkB [Ilumatobacteraceae bacterium]